MVDLVGESEDEDEPVGDGAWSDGSQILLDAEVLDPDSGAFILLTLNSPLPVERDSIMLLNPDPRNNGVISKGISLALIQTIVYYTYLVTYSCYSI